MALVVVTLDEIDQIVQRSAGPFGQISASGVRAINFRQERICVEPFFSTDIVQQAATSAAKIEFMPKEYSGGSGAGNGQIGKRKISG
jgi:hypothetical protein